MTPEEAAVARRRAARRAVIKAHHPDRGGDPARFVELLAAIDRPSGAHAETDENDRTGPSRRRRRRQVVRRFRQRLPRRVPGARRYATY